MSIDNIEPSVPTVMTAELVRLFDFAGCKPTACHACKRRIKVGDTFQLIPHLKPGDDNKTDEMVCGTCGEDDLVRRDKRLEAATRRIYANGGFVTGPQPGFGGYSRPSKP